MMATYNRYPAMDATNNFPPTVREALASSPEHMSVTKALVFSEVPKYISTEPVLASAAKTAVEDAIRDRNVPVILSENYTWAHPLTVDRNTIGLWRFNGNLIDSGPGNHTLTKVAGSGNTTYVSTDPKFGSHHLRLSATSKGLYAPGALDDFIAPANPVPVQDVTLEGWAKTTASGAVQVIAGRGSAYWIGMSTSGTAYAGYNLDNISTTQFLGGGSGHTRINDGKWHHLALVMKNSAGSLYCDGVLVSSSTAICRPSNYADSVFAIGLLMPNMNFGWIGDIDEVRYSLVSRSYNTSVTYEARPSVPGGFVTYLGTSTPAGMLKGDSWRKVAMI